MVPDSDLDRLLEPLRRRSKTTYATYHGILQRYLHHAGATRPTPHQAEEYLRSLEQSGLRATSLRTCYFALRWYYRTIGREGAIDHLWTQIPRETPRESDHLTKPQVLQVLQATASPRDRAIIMLFFDLGLRRQELIDLDRIDLQTMEGLHSLQIQRKRGLQQRLPLSEATYQAIQIHLQEMDGHGERGDLPLFRGPQGTRIHPSTIRKMVATAGDRSRIRPLGEGPALHPHTFRHSCATYLLSQRANIADISALLGHNLESQYGRGIATTIYLHNTYEGLVRLPPRWTAEDWRGIQITPYPIYRGAARDRLRPRGA